MTFNPTELQVPIFTGINDDPIVPTDASAGNGSDLISRHNLLVTRIVSAFSSIAGGSSSTTGTWRILEDINSIFSVNDKNRILIDPTLGVDVALSLSSAQVYPGFGFSVLSTNPPIKVSILGISRFSGNSPSGEEIYFSNNPKTIEFIYINSNIGWYSDANAVIDFQTTAT